MDDLQTFTLAFAIVWIALALYLVRLHTLLRRVERQAGATAIRSRRP